MAKDFRFINDNVYGKGVELAEDSFHSGCTCVGVNDCKYSGCDCLADQEDDDEDDDGAMNLDGVEPRKKTKYRYRDSEGDAGLLPEEFLDSSAPIYECHRECSCSKDCPNRVVERGRTIPIQIFRTKDNRGWGELPGRIAMKCSANLAGVRTLRDIRQGQFVDRYVGEVITSAEADRRRRKSTISKKKDVYLFALDKFTDENSLDPRLRGPPLEIDGEFMSGPTRFVNHSCDPNMKIFARVGDHADKHIHDLALFAIKDIEANDELTFDYLGGGQDGEDDFDGDKKDMTKCRCGTSKCRGYLW